MNEKNDPSKKNAQLDHDILAEIDPVEQHINQLYRYQKGKQRSEEICAYIKTVNSESGNAEKWLEKEYEALENCGSWMLFRDYYTLHEKPRMVAGCTCKKHLLCGICAIRRTGKALAIYSAKINEVLSCSDTPLDKIFITFTIKNGLDLHERIEHLMVSMKKLLHKRRNALSQNPKTDTVLKHVTSAVYTYEVTHNDQTGEFHPHVHMVALLPRGAVKFSEKIEINKKTGSEKSYFVPVKFRLNLIEDWKKITQDSWNIDVRQIEDSKESGPDVGENSLMKAIIETFKYAVKVGENKTSIQIAMYEALKGRRLIGSFGALRGIKVPKNLNDTPLDDSELPYIDMLYEYCGAEIGYQITEVGQFDCSRSPEEFLDFENRMKRNKRFKKGTYQKSVDRQNQLNRLMDEFIERKKTQYDDCLEVIHDYYNEKNGVI